MSGVKRCAACGKENPVSEMKICMHNQMHRYVCDMKCMDDFYNPPNKPAAQSLESKVSAIEAERDTLRAQVATLQSDANSWQSGYDKGRHDGSKHRQDEVKQLAEQVEAMRAALEKISAYAPCSGIKDPGLTKMHMGILARDAIDPALQAKP